MIRVHIHERVFAAAAVFVMLPMWLLIALLIRLLAGRPVLIREELPSERKEQWILRFRTDTRGSSGFALLSKLLRKGRCHRWPGLWDVVCGRASLKEIGIDRDALVISPPADPFFVPVLVLAFVAWSLWLFGR